MLQNPDEQAPLAQLAHHHGRERPVDVQVGAKQDPAADAGVEEISAGRRRDVNHRNRVPNERQGGPDAVVALRSGADGEVAGLTPGSAPQCGQVDRESLLELPRPTGRDQGRAGRAAVDVDEQTRPIGFGPGAG